MFKSKQFIGLSSFILTTVFSFVVFSGCTKAPSADNVDVDLTENVGGVGLTLANGEVSSTAGVLCITPQWTYTDAIPSGFCINSDNYKGDSNAAYQVAGTCTSVWENVTTPGTALLQVYNILIDCASGSLTSSSFYNPSIIDGVTPVILENNKASFTVTCNVYGQVRAKKTKTYFSTPAC